MYRLICISVAGTGFTESKLLHHLHHAWKSYLYFFTVFSDLEFKITEGSLLLNSFKRLSLISCIDFHLPIVNKPEKCIEKKKWIRYPCEKNRVIICDKD